MRESVHIALLHAEIHHGQPVANLRTVLSMAEEAARAGARLILAPELAISGFAFDGRHDVAPYVEEVTGDTVSVLAELARRYGVYVGSGFTERDAATDIFYNSAVLIAPSGETVAHHRKIATERRWAAPGSLSPSSSVETPWGRVGLLICADTYYGILPRAQALYGVDLLLVPANWPPAGLDPRELWRARALENGLGIVACNRTGVDRRMDCRVCASFVTTETGEVLHDGVSPTSAIWHVDYPLRAGRFATASRQATLAERRPDRYGALSLDMNNLDDFAGLWGLPAGGTLDVCCVVPDAAGDTDHLSAHLRARCERDANPGLLIFPPHAAPVTEEQLLRLAAQGMAVIGPLCRPGQPGHGMGVFSGTYHWLTADQDAIMLDVGPARVALLHPSALRHPECAIALAKQGCDLAVTLSETLGDDDRLCLGVKCLEGMAVAMAADNAASICLPPAAHARWDETVQQGPGLCVQRVQTVQRRKRFQDRVDMGILLRR
jgi:predicted amidohydrolase